MKRSILLVMSTICLVFVAVQASAVSLKNQRDKLSYAMGAETGKAFKKHGIKVNPAAFAAGIQDATRGKKMLMTQTQIRAVLTNFQKQSMAKMQKQMQKMAAKNKRMGVTFLTSNKKRAGVITTPSGLQYKVIKKGNGASPTKKNTVTVNYEGRLINGTVFDSSYKRGKPVTFPVAGVIPGWQEALMHMKPGATWMLYIPSKLAYGVRGAPGSIPPNATLIFKVNLISVKK